LWASRVNRRGAKKHDSLKENMGQTGFMLLFLIFVAVSALFLRRWMLDALIEGINDFFNNFRGGPPTPMHPSPADDAALLRRRPRKVEN
jgi:hypothetical protein